MGPVRMPSSMCKPARVAQGISGATVSLIFFFFLFFSLPQVTVLPSQVVFLSLGLPVARLVPLAVFLPKLLSASFPLWEHCGPTHQLPRF